MVMNKIMIEKDVRKKDFFNVTVLDRSVYDNLTGKFLNVDFATSE